MLVLSRKTNERISIGGPCIITVVDIDRGKIRLGIEAPKECEVYREDANPNHLERVLAYIQHLDAEAAKQQGGK